MKTKSRCNELFFTMKKSIILIIMCFAITGLKAQGEWSFGPRIGYGLSKNIWFDNEHHANFIMGLSGEYKIKKFATELDVLFTEQGTFMETYKCILIPLKFKFYPCTTNGFNVFAGPQLNIYKEEPGETSTGGGILRYRKTTASIMVGVGYRFKSGIDIAINYNHGLVPINKQDIKGKKWHEQVFQITVGYDLHRLFK